MVEGPEYDWISADDGSRIIDHGDGCFLFLLAASAAFHLLFLTELLILAAGVTGLQVAASPYVDLLGKPETASSRLDLTQPSTRSARLSHRRSVGC
jgi:hypothetical protein